MGPALPLQYICLIMETYALNLVEKFVQNLFSLLKCPPKVWIISLSMIFRTKQSTFTGFSVTKKKGNQDLATFLGVGGESTFSFLLMLPSFTTGFLFFVSFLPAFAQTLIEGLDIILLPAVITIALWIVRSSCFPE